LREEELAAPELIDLEIVSVLRRQLSVGALDVRRAQLVIDDLRDLPMQRASRIQEFRAVLAACRARRVG
jgi:hypothetical protein